MGVLICRSCGNPATHAVAGLPTHAVIDSRRFLCGIRGVETDYYDPAGLLGRVETALDGILRDLRHHQQHEDTPVEVNGPSGWKDIEPDIQRLMNIIDGTA